MRLGLLTLACLSCAPPLEDQPWLVAGPRVLAVTAEPPEAAPGARVALRAVVAGPAGPMDGAEVRWWRCDQPRGFSQNEPVNPDCLAALDGAAAGADATELPLPADACARFGPDAPAAGVRPRDADATGGYYQPVGVELGEQRAFAFVRLGCQPAGISSEVAQAWRQQARANTNPRFTVQASSEGTPVGFDELAAGATVELAADWSASPEEAFPVVDPATAQLTTQLERYDVAWFVTGGTLSSARSASGAGRWTLPSEPGQGTLWALLRDSRGGVAVWVAAARWR